MLEIYYRLMDILVQVKLVKHTNYVNAKKLIVDWIPRERGKRGRPRKTWMDGVQAAMTKEI